MIPGPAVDDSTLKALSRFIRDLTDRNDIEIKNFISEISLNSQFHSQLDAKRNSLGRRQYRRWGWGISETLGMVLYSLCRIQQPAIVIETGVSTGVSSSYILSALNENKLGELYSMDPEPNSGWLIPDYFRTRWHFVNGRSSEELASIFEKVGQVDIFLHDSEHTYRNMLWEFTTAWPHLKAGGLLLSHNIDANSAFSDFCRHAGIRGHALDEMGGLVKPVTSNTKV
jgi:predicted O-methyltransferase YrrM